jgi:CRP/FNR family cyclic AMP-dependent transcriptional regulator
MQDLDESGTTQPALRDIGRFTRSYQAGERIFSAGDVGHCMHVLVAGEVAIVRDDAGQTQQINRLGVGDCFGEIALLEDGVRTASAVALVSPTRVVEIDKARFVYLVGQQPAFALTVMRSLTRRMSGRDTTALSPAVSPSA